MKLVIIISSFSNLAIAACNNVGKNTETVQTIVIQDTAVVNMSDNSLTSLDWEGRYIGTVPCADCEGIETTVTLSKSLNYWLAKKYLGKSDAIVSESKGIFTWNKRGNTITLSGVMNAPSQYMVGENKLIQLDIQGQRITGENASKYELIKNNNEK